MNEYQFVALCVLLFALGWLAIQLSWRYPNLLTATGLRLPRYTFQCQIEDEPTLFHLMGGCEEHYRKTGHRDYFLTITGEPKRFDIVAGEIR